LVIDPLLVYSTYLGGDGSDAAFGIAVDAEGNAYVTGQTLSVNFPTASPLDPFLDDVRRFDAFVTKLNPEGTAAVYSTFLGGSSSDLGAAIAVDSARSAYVAGSTNSPDFPTTPGAFSRVLKSPRGAFVLKLNGAGSALIYSTYLGGDTSDDARHIALGLDGCAFVSGITFSRDFPTTSGAVQRALGGGITDAFVTRLSPSGSDLVYSTYLGGSAEEFDSGIAVDAASNAYVSGTTSSSDFPTTPGAFQTTAPGGGDAFVTKLNPDGSAFVYSTYLGGRFSDSGGGLAVDADGNALVTGDSGSPDFPVVRPIQSAAGGGGQRARVFVTKLDAQGAGLLYSTQLGGSTFSEHPTAMME
jgi:hypothetical protein